MTPFLLFRVWLRRGPGVERATAGIALLLVVALGVWGLLPVEQAATHRIVGTAADDGGAPADASPPDVGAAPQGSTTGNGASGGADVAGAGEGGGATSVAPGGAGASADPGGRAPAGSPGAPTADGSADAAATPSADRCAAANVQASDQGVTAKEVFVAVPIIDLAGSFANEAFGIRRDLEALANAAAAGINRSGGVACRRLRIKTYRVNPLDQNEPRARCLQIVADKPFAVIDFGAYLAPVQRRCFVENRLPMQVALAITEEEATSAFPFMYTASASADRQLRSWVYSSADRGVFRAANFQKLGVVMDDCNPKITAGLLADLRAVGLRDQQVSMFKVSCDSGGSADQMFQAVVQHRRDGATHVLLAIAQLAATTYVQDAESVGYRPAYQASDYGAVTTTTSEGNWPGSFDGTVAVTSGRGGEINSGMVSDPLLQDCKKWYTDAGVPPPEEDGDSALAFCTIFRLFQATANAAGPALTRSRLLVDGLPRVGRFRSVSYLDATFDKVGKVTGGDSVRTIRWQRECRCFKVDDPAIRPAR